MNLHPEAPIEISDGSSEFASEGDDDQLNQLKSDLLRCLDKIQTTGHVAVSKHHDAFINPGLMIADTLIPLPLVPRDAETIRNASRQAPFGKGDKTVVDTSVRNTWELDHTQFSVANPAWKAYIASLLEDAARNLAMSEVRAEPYKLLLYEEGSFFKRHKDSEKVPGMVGTLVICLPSKHEGGSVHLSHIGKKYVFETDKTSAFGLTSLSWFSDVTHEIKPLTSGYRLVLTYNIIHTGHRQISASIVGKQLERLRSVLLKWQSNLPFREKLVYVLEHKYTKSSLKLSNLKGRDRAICKSLYEVGLSCGFTIFLARMTRTESEDYDGYLDEDKNFTELEDIITCDGLAVCNSTDLEEDDILGSDLWNRDPDSEEEGEFTGNESMPPTLRYHDTVVVIVPMTKITLEHRPNENRLQTSLLTILENAIKRSSPNDALLPDVIDLAIKLQAKTLYQVALYAALKDPSSRLLVLGTIVRHIKEDHLKSPEKHIDWDSWFGTAFSGATDISLVVLADILNRIDALIQDEDLKVSFRTWKALITQRMVESKRSLDMKDHDYLILLLFTQSKDLEWLTNWFAPTLASKGSKLLICTILREIYANRERKLFENATDAYRYILRSSIEKLALQSNELRASYTPYISGAGGRESLSYEITIEVIRLGLDMGLSKEAIKLLEMSCINVHKSCLEPNAKTTLPASEVRNFLETLLTVLQNHKVPPNEAIKNMFAALFRNVLIGELPTRPVKLQGWEYKQIYCPRNYNECQELNSFLADANEQTREFVMVEQKRRHLEYHLTSKAVRCHTRKGRAPYGLVVTKLGTEFEEDMKNYEYRLSVIRDRFALFQCEYVKSLLGEKLYEELVLLKDTSSADGAGTASTSGRKRKAEEDLDGSSASRPKLIE
ncbi:hypothetical protein Daesc_004111 [Daldinia eschscholtzii]|uniref:Prolyl 4-hydroxylase alpha subunit Fe(2+) 2OG dioxygenase domain-containing protein n=1 Tax=Daldinia eschscholtzii TaxID=292717 RepID=A0AAX6MNF3_9PEZI